MSAQQSNQFIMDAMARIAQLERANLHLRGQVTTAQMAAELANAKLRTAEAEAALAAERQPAAQKPAPVAPVKSEEPTGKVATCQSCQGRYALKQGPSFNRRYCYECRPDWGEIARKARETTAKMPCASCAYARHSVRSETGFECKIERFLDCAPHSGARLRKPGTPESRRG